MSSFAGLRWIGYQRLAFFRLTSIMQARYTDEVSEFGWNKKMGVNLSTRRNGITTSTAGFSDPPQQTSARVTIPYKWYWEGDDGSWNMYDASSSSISSDVIEGIYQEEPYGCIPFTKNGNSYVIDLRSGLQINKTTCKQRRVSRFKVQYDWFWEDDDGRWRKYNSAASNVSSDQITASFYEDLDDSFRFNLGGTPYVIDFKSMKQINDITKESRLVMHHEVSNTPSAPAPIVRTPTQPAIATGDYPETWDLNAPKTSSGYQLVNVAPVGSTASEYRAITWLFNDSVPSVPLISVKRIQNKQLWRSFALARSQLEERLGRGNGVEHLFHGGSRSSYEGICTHGIDPRLSGISNGTAYGNGSYFALDASYSIRYADSRALIVAQVLVGEFALGSSDITRPPPKDQRQPNGFLYDSCVDDLNTPKIFVVFERAHSYPEYLIEY